jgi:hypothetical protein
VTKYYTATEANALLPEVRTLVEELRRAFRGLADPQARALIQRAMTGNGGGPKLQGQLESAGQFEAALKRLQEWGCQLRDAETGLLDFPSLRDGKEVWLCWLPGEEQVAFWHSTDTGYADRQPL